MRSLPKKQKNFKKILRISGTEVLILQLSAKIFPCQWQPIQNAGQLPMCILNNYSRIKEAEKVGERIGRAFQNKDFHSDTWGRSISVMPKTLFVIDYRMHTCCQRIWIIFMQLLSSTIIAPSRFISAVDLQTVATNISELQLLLKNSSLQITFWHLIA